MNRQKKIFIAISIIFLLALTYASYDLARRTTFPGSKPQLKQRIMEQFEEPDTVKTDSLGNRL
jgi:hypothetical protein